MPLRISRHEAGQPTAIGPQGQSKGLKCVPVSFGGSCSTHSSSAEGREC